MGFSLDSDVEYIEVSEFIKALNLLKEQTKYVITIFNLESEFNEYFKLAEEIFNLKAQHSSQKIQSNDIITDLLLLL